MSGEQLQKSLIFHISGRFCEPALCPYWKRGMLVTASGHVIPDLPIGICVAPKMK